MALGPNRTTNHSSPLPYLACLVPDVSMEIQEKLRNITNSVLLPLSLTSAALSFISNSLLLVAVARIKTRQHPSLVLLCNLSVSDLMSAAFYLYRDTRKATHPHLCPPKSEEETHFARLCLFLTLSNLAVISIDRFRAIRRPRWYLNHVTSSRVMKEAFISWLSSVTAVLLNLIVFRLLPVKSVLIKNIISVTFYVACTFIIIACYIGIFVTIRSHRKNMLQFTRRHSVATLEREKKLAVTVGLILLVLAFTLLPSLASPLVLSVMGYRSKAPFRQFFTVFITLNGLLNPAINCGRNKAIQRSVIRLFKRQRHIRHAYVPRSAVVPICDAGENIIQRKANVSMETETQISTKV